LANLYWDGRYTRKDPVRALALVTVAVENASEEDRFWIEDLHQSIFCEAKQKTRQRVHQVVGGWRQRFGRTQNVSIAQNELGNISGNTQRVCSNGDIVGDLLPRSEELPSGGDKSGTINAAVSTIAVPSVTVPSETARRSRSETSYRRSKPQQEAAKISRIKPTITDRSSLNGFPAKTDKKQAASADSDADRRALNGFAVKGATARGAAFGLSFSPGQ